MMVLASLSTALIAFVLMVSGNPVSRVMRVHDRLEVVPTGFAAAEMARSETLLHLRIALTARNITGLETVLMSVSAPGSPSYGKYLSLDQVKEYTSPSVESVTVVKAWLAEHNVTNVAVTGAYNDLLSFSVPAGTANSLFSSSFQNYVDLDSGERIIRTQQYSIPEELESHIAFVHPTTSFAKSQFGPTAPLFSIPIPNYNVTELANPVPGTCGRYITPACLQALYGIPTSPATQSSNSMSVTGFLNQYANRDDLAQFLKDFRRDVNSNTSFKDQFVDGGMNSQDISEAGLEANLDIQYTVGVATGVPVTFVSVGQSNNDFVDAFNVLISQTEPPTVVTTSYGYDEADLPKYLANYMCNQYMSLGTRGVSVLFASGDGGVAGTRQKQCTIFVPTFPASCPWQTAVGATGGINPEVAASLSSGGFSNYFPSPDYQKPAISKYLTALGSTNSGRYHASGRAFPDVAAQGEKVIIGYRGRYGLVEGTSCSSPIFASVISLINDRLIAAGKPVLGFLNPFIYANPQAFFDITAGSNPGCDTNGFPATTGWNPVTGMGTPNFSALLKAAGL
ncbi:family S53 protease-like protein [Mucidula mucida]|nr:family S53 protease-like protein [Mucidula mucida]